MATDNYRYIDDINALDSSQVQFTFHVANANTYMRLSLVNERDLVYLQSIESGTIIGFFQQGIDRTTVRIAGDYDTDHGIHVEGTPIPALLDQQFYEIRFTAARPGDQIPTPPENRGWSPVLALEPDGDRIVLKIADWVSGQGTKPSLGYLGLTGLVTDIALAVDIRGLRGFRGSYWSTGDNLPASPQLNDQHLFIDPVASGIEIYSGNTRHTSANGGDIVEFDGTRWQRKGNIVDDISSVLAANLLPNFPTAGQRNGKIAQFVNNTLTWVQQVIGLPTFPATGSRDGKGLQFEDDTLVWKEIAGATDRYASEIDRLDSLIADMRLETPPAWVAATDGVLALFDSATTVNVAAINAVTNWAVSPTIPSASNVIIIIRVPEDAHIEDYRVLTNHNGFSLNGLQKLTDAGLTGYDYYTLLISTGGVTFIRLEHHGVDIHTRYLGALVKERITELITELLLPDPSSGTVGQVAAVNSDRDGYNLVNQSGGGITTQLQQTIDNLVEKTLDLVITKRPDWVLADATKAQFTTITRDSTPAQNLASGQPPTGATGWTNDVTLTSTRVLVVRIKDTENLSDYRFLFDQPPGVTLNFSALTQYASDGSWVYYGENTLTNESTGRIRLQHHGVDVTSRFIGDLDRDKVLAALAGMILEKTPRRVDTMPTLLEGEVVYLTQNDNSGSTNYRKGTYQGVETPANSGTIVPVQVLVPNQEILLDALQRILPSLPAEGSRDNKVAKFNDDRLEWIVDTGTSVFENVEWFIDVTPNYIIKPAFRGVFTVFLHDIATDEAGFEDVRRIVIRIGGAAVHIETWRATDSKRVITFEVDATEAANLVNNHAAATSLNVEINFQNASNTDLFDRSFTIAATTTDPNAGQDARLLPELPATGSRDNKIAKFAGDVLGWEDDEGGAAGETVPVFAEIPIVVNQTLANRAASPTQLNLGTPSNVLNNSGEIEVSGGNAIQLAAGGYAIRLSLLVNDRSGTNDARTTFMAALYDSGGNELQKIEPLVGYNRNISAHMTRMNHTGDFLLNMASAGAISVRAKVYQVGDNANPAHTTQSGAAVRIFKIGGPRGEKGDAGGPLAAADRARLLPTLPASGSRNDKVPKFNGNTLGWEEDSGITNDERARLLPTLPATGSRDDKIPIFSGDTLGWEDVPSGSELRVVEGFLSTPKTGDIMLPTNFRDYDLLMITLAISSSQFDTVTFPISGLPTTENGRITIGFSFSTSIYTALFINSSPAIIRRANTSTRGITNVALLKL